MYSGLQVRYRHCQVLLTFEFSRHIFENTLKYQEFMKIRPGESRDFPCGLTDGHEKDNRCISLVTACSKVAVVFR